MAQPTRRLMLCALAGLLGQPWQAVLAADSQQEANALVEQARLALAELLRLPGFDGMRRGLKSARAVLIFPSVVKGGVVVGGAGGSGVLLVRGDNDQWSAPAFYTLGALSIGAQVGAQAAPVVILVNSRKAVDKLMGNSLKLGGEVSVAVGAMGRGRAANLTADLVSYSHGRGAYLGANIEGALLDVRESLNSAYYGKSVTPSDILLSGSATNPQADALRAAVAAAGR